MQNAFETKPRTRHGAALIRVAIGAYFMAFGAGMIPGKDVTVLTAHMGPAPYDALIAGALICPIAFLVIMGRLYTPALIALIAAFVAVAVPQIPQYPIDFATTGWADPALVAAMFFAIFLGQPDHRHPTIIPRQEPGAPAQVTDLASPTHAPRILNQPTIRMRRAMSGGVKGESLNIFREEFLGK